MEAILRQMHMFSDIDTRRTIEDALDWPRLAHALPPPDLDLIQVKKDAARVWLQGARGVYISIRLSPRKRYRIEIDIYKGAWRKMKQGQFRMYRHPRTWMWEGVTETAYLEDDDDDDYVGWVATLMLSEWRQTYNCRRPNRKYTPGPQFWSDERIVVYPTGDTDTPRDYRLTQKYTIKIPLETDDTLITRRTDCI